MNIILLEKVPNVGDFGQQVRVKGGFARNYLIPRRKALLATAQNIEIFNQKKTELEQQSIATLQAAQDKANNLLGKEITLSVQAGPQGKLYGSVTLNDIVGALEKMGITLDKKQIRLLQSPIRQLGTYEVVIKLHENMVQTLLLHVAAEKHSTELP
ncbi:MAG: 50S ribosomal protein L9 [Gammaproteobacteria bacterium]|nr:50S ribosomal protein L9 [Gammaproteobacteria bacterium]